MLYYVGRVILFFLGLLPVRLMAYIGRGVGEVVYWIDKRHRNVAIKNLTLVFSKEKSKEEILALAKENFKRVIEAYFSAIATLQKSPETVLKHYLKVYGAENVPPNDPAIYSGKSRVALIGHFGNFELYAKVAPLLPHLQFATTYRGLDNKVGDALLSALRSNSRCLYFERRSEGKKVRDLMSRDALLIGLLADQHPGRHGVRAPFMGVECLCSPSAAVFALRYDCPITPSFCYRVEPGRWEIYLEKEIPTKVNGVPRSVEEIVADCNAAYERAIRRDPANWFWVHNRWKK